MAPLCGICLMMTCISLVLQVEPLLEVLVGSTLEQGLMEVLQEEELAAMRSQQQRFEQVGGL